MSHASVFPQDPQWAGEGTSRIPFWAYTREDLYKKELDQFLICLPVVLSLKLLYLH